MKALKYCANGDGNLVSPPSLVICKSCRNKITENLKGIITEMEKDAQPVHNLANPKLQEGIDYTNMISVR